DPLHQHLDAQFQLAQVEAVLGGVFVVGGMLLGMHGLLADEGADVLLQLAVAYLVAHRAHAVDEELLAIGEQGGEVVHEVGHERIAAPPVAGRAAEGEVHAADRKMGGNAYGLKNGHDESSVRHSIGRLIREIRCTHLRTDERGFAANQGLAAANGDQRSSRAKAVRVKTGMPMSCRRREPPSSGRSTMEAASYTRAPMRRVRLAAASRVPPVAIRSSTSSTESPSHRLSACTSITASPYSVW